MKLRKINDIHFVITHGNPTTNGDYAIHSITLNVSQHHSKDNSLSEGWEKIEFSTQPIERFNWMGNSEKGYDTIKPLSLQEVKELIGEVDVEKNMWYERNVQNPYSSDSLLHTGFNKGFELGYNQAIEDNKEKKYTEKAIRKAIEMARDIKDDSAHDIFTAEDISGCAEVCTYGWRNRYKGEEIIQSLQPKTEWEVEFDENGKLRLA